MKIGVIGIGEMGGTLARRWCAKGHTVRVANSLGRTGWSLSPAYDLNPTPADLKARILTTNIDLDEGTCSLDLVESASEYFGLGLIQARTVIKEVAAVTATWRAVARETGARPAEINRMASAFEHDDLTKALAL